MKPLSGNVTDSIGRQTVVATSGERLLDKIFLGLSRRDYFGQLLANPVNWALFLILAVGIPLLCQRYLFGLQAISHGSQDYPWGVLLGFGLFGMVPLSASGFLLSTTVEIFQRDDFRPIERLALLNGLLGYFFAVVFLLVDLGMPWRLTYPMVVSFGPAAVLFLVAWHVATYLSVQIAEMLPAVSEWANWPSLKRFVKKITLGLTIAGIILSTLHQGALGALFCYAPVKIHPLWIAPEFQWLHFFVSSIFAGLCMVIVVSWLVGKTMSWRCDRRFLTTLDDITLGLAKGAAMAMITYLVIKIVAIAHDQEWLLLISGWGALLSAGNWLRYPGSPDDFYQRRAPPPRHHGALGSPAGGRRHCLEPPQYGSHLLQLQDAPGNTLLEGAVGGAHGTQLLFHRLPVFPLSDSSSVSVGGA